MLDYIFFYYHNFTFTLYFNTSPYNRPIEGDKVNYKTKLYSPLLFYRNTSKSNY